jgi:carbamoyl-phosphate synthase small subunit
MSGSHDSKGASFVAVSRRGEPGLLALADGTVFRGRGFGGGLNRVTVGEVVFNTSMGGYQEILTDPSYAGQIITFTTPHIGNVGCNDDDNESDKVFAQGTIIRDLSLLTSNFRGERTFGQFLEERDKVGIHGIDTRSLVLHLRTHGAQMGALGFGDDAREDDLIDQAKAFGSIEGRDFVSEVTCKHPYQWREGTWSLKGRYQHFSADELEDRPHVLAVDCGIKRTILRLLIDQGVRVTVVPATMSADELLAFNPDGVFLSNGPGDPASLTSVVEMVKGIVSKVPLFGICLGHQILARALGADTYKLKFGHRGGNHPVKNLVTGRVEITVQNHGFAVTQQGLTPLSALSHINLNDHTVEGLMVRDAHAFSVQYHPEASPGPNDSRYLFTQFSEYIRTFRER